MIFLTILSLLAMQVHSAPTNEDKRERSGKFMRFGSADDLFSEVLDEMHDPLSAAEDMGMEDRLKGSAHQNSPSTYHFSIKNGSGQNPIKTEEKIALYNQNTGKFELITSTSGHFMLPVKPVTENGVIYYGGQQYHYRRPDSEDPHVGNRTGEIKIFWSSVTDAIENLPFLPVQVNVPDMIGAMANFLTSSIPIINRFTNPNHPRLPVAKPPTPVHNQQQDPYGLYHYGSNLVQEQTVEDRELKNGVNVDGRKQNKQRKGQKRKNQKRKNNKGSTKGITGARPFFKRTTEGPTSDKKVWQAFGSGEPLGNTVKNMPISRKKIAVRDREVFNFRNSDIHNSPIMILNLPERPMMYHKTNINQRVNERGDDHTPVEKPLSQDISPTTARPKPDRTNSKKTAQKRVKDPAETRKRN